jgi:hypothetical protein
MHTECYRCRADLDEADNAQCCPHCGAPQLRLSSSISAEGDELSTTGELPPPKPRLLDWRVALRGCVSLSAIGLVLFVLASYLPSLTFASLLWVVCSPFLATMLYQKRVPDRLMSGGVGARIGLTVGLLTAASLGAALSAVGLIARYALHSMGAFDQEVAQKMQEQIQRSASANPLPADVLQQMMSPEFRTGVLLFALFMLVSCVVFFSTLGGAFAGMLSRERRRVTG